MSHDESLIEVVFDRLAAADVPAEVAEVVLASFVGDAELAAALRGESTNVDIPRHPAPQTPPGIHLASVTVAGFRGVGPERCLTIEPGPGLTVVAGRNGSGKSSFAEAVEVALTGTSSRFADRTSVWRTGWRNLHTSDPCHVEVKLRTDGSAAATRIRRSWPADAKLTDGHPTVSGTVPADLARSLDLYRPFLTSGDLSRLISGTDSESFDAIHSILGLQPLNDADDRLAAASRRLNDAVREHRAVTTQLRDRLGDVDDDRARRTITLLGRRDPDLDAVAGILAEPAATADPLVTRWEHLALLETTSGKEVDALAAELATVDPDLARHDENRERSLVRTAELLRVALDHHAADGDGPCPVCATGTLDNAWRETAAASLTALREATYGARRKSARATELDRRARNLIESVQRACADLPDDPAVDPLRASVARLSAVPTGPAALAAHLAEVYPAVDQAIEAARQHARDWLARRSHGWLQVVDDVRLWLAAARRDVEDRRMAALAKKASKELKEQADGIRNGQLAPFAAESQRIWDELRQESNVRLGAMSLHRAGKQRKVVFPVGVDDADNGHALGVMSQGELHALGLATFLPRSCAQESPFRFIIIDDPVQSMDPSKVDGLARVLARLAETRQVVVFTHDSRLPDALQRLEIDATVWNVVRAERSVLTLKRGMDPVSRYLTDARALAASDRLDEPIRRPVVAELCRSALEAACHRKFWKQSVNQDRAYADIEAALRDAKRTTTVFALALFDDAERGGDVKKHLRERHGQWAVEVFDAVRKGVHGRYHGRLGVLVDESKRLAEALA